MYNCFVVVPFVAPLHPFRAVRFDAMRGDRLRALLVRGVVVPPGAACLPFVVCFPVLACVGAVCACRCPLGGNGCARVIQPSLGKVPRPGVVATRQIQAVKPCD